MPHSIPLNNKNIQQLPHGIERPSYDRQKLVAGMVHVGVGGFHRSHQAYYTDELLKNHGVTDWAICGVGLMENDKKMQEALESQDHLYSLMLFHPEGNITTRVIGSITDYLYAPDDPEAVIEKMADPEIKIVSLTITEGGYNVNEATREFDFENKDVQWDLKNPDNPKTIFGFLCESLRRRKERELPAYNILSCDNIQHNGDVTKKMLLAFCSNADPGLCRWIEQNVNFPNCMVDRITPATTEEARTTLLTKSGINDKCPVVCEPFCQWVIEDNFNGNRPPWEKVGVQFVPDVSPYEKMKIRLLNAGHSLLGFSGALYGYEYIHETVHDPLFSGLLHRFMDEEVTTVLDAIPGIDLDLYKESLVQRFGNPYIKDQVARICLQSSAKIPKYLLPTIHDQLKAGGPLDCSAYIIASWCRYAEGTDEKGRKYQLEDEMSAILQEKALLSRQDPLAFLKIEPVFGDLVRSERFTEIYKKALQDLYQKGVVECLKELNLKMK